MSSEKGEKFGKYTLIRKLATGGMAEIWLAEQRGPGGFNKELVIKRILPHLADEGDMAQMFIDEARLVAQLTHPNIGQVFELGEHEGDYFIAMEFIDGMDLSDLMKKCRRARAPLPISYAVKIVQDLLRALDYAHEFEDREGKRYEVIHRDISPQNVLVSTDGIVKLVDFGVAKAELNRHKTETGAVKGKYGYMAPEQIDSAQLDRRVDLFALGAVFFELLTGNKAFGDDLKAISRITSGEVPDPRDYRQDLPEQLVQVVETALAHDRDDRFADAVEMERALDEFVRQSGATVGQRELANLVRELEGKSGAAVTDQLFGAQKHGVDKSGPRLTDDGSGKHATVNETPRERTVTVRDGGGEAEDAGTESRLPWVIAAGMVLMVGIATAGLFVMVSLAEPRPVAAGDVDVEAVEEEAGEAVWGDQQDVRIVVIDTEEGDIAALWRDGEKVGQTPFQTYLQPGQHEVEVETGGEREASSFTVGEEPVQRVWLRTSR